MEDGRSPPGEPGPVAVGDDVYARPFGTMFTEAGAEPWQRGTIIGADETDWIVDFIDWNYDSLYVSKSAAERLRLRKNDPQPPLRKTPSPRLSNLLRKRSTERSNVLDGEGTEGAGVTDVPSHQTSTSTGVTPNPHADDMKTAEAAPGAEVDEKSESPPGGTEPKHNCSGVRSTLHHRSSCTPVQFPDGHHLAGRGILKHEPGMMPHEELEEFHLDEDMAQRTCTPCTWSNCDATSYRTRIGPDYARNGKKEHSSRAIYSVFAVDAFSCPNKIPDIAQYMNIPRLDATGLPVPPVIIINIMAPWYAPANPLWGAKVTDGQGYQLVLYAAITDWAADAYRSGDLPNSLKLLQNFITESQEPNWDESEFRKRFKVIAKIANVKHVQFNGLLRGLVNRYNAKPFIARDSSTMYTSPGHYFQVDIDIHAGFGYPARSGLWNIKDIISELIFDLGFVIEGHPDEQLPEQILCCARIAQPKLEEMVKPFPYETPPVEETKGKKQ